MVKHRGIRSVEYSGSGLVLLLSIAVLALSLESTANAEVLRVPFEYPDITSAAAAAQPGDSVLVWPPPGDEYVGQFIELKQGVVLRGVWDEHFENLYIEDSDIHLLNTPAGITDTTRVEHFRITDPYRHETFQVYTPFSRIDSCVIRTYGPYEWPAMRIWEGASITRCQIRPNGAGISFEFRQGTLEIAWNLIFALGGRVENEGASQPAQVRIRNNTIAFEEWLIELRADSEAEVVNNVLHGPVFTCQGSGSVDFRFNDFYESGVWFCPIGEGNIYEFPMYCDEPDWWLHPDSPCVGAGEGGANIGAFGVGCGTVSVGSTGAEVPSCRSDVRLWPNPTHIASKMSFSLRHPAIVALEIYDTCGRTVLRRQTQKSAGYHTMDVRVQDLHSGVYYYEIKLGGTLHAGRFVVVK
jgi:hypothetical protein